MTHFTTQSLAFCAALFLTIASVAAIVSVPATEGPMPLSLGEMA